MTSFSLTTKHCASAAAHWLQSFGSMYVPVMDEFSVIGFATKYGPNTGIEVDRMVEVRG